MTSRQGPGAKGWGSRLKTLERRGRFRLKTGTEGNKYGLRPLEERLTGVRTETMEKGGDRGQRPSLDHGRKKPRPSLDCRDGGWGPSPGHGEERKSRLRPRSGYLAWTTSPGGSSLGYGGD